MLPDQEKNQEITRLTVIVPVYRSESFLADCINQYLQVTLDDTELLIVGDGPSEEARKIVGQFQPIHKKIRYIEHERNRGLLEARRTGVEQARGEFIAFLDPDDQIVTSVYEKACAKAAATAADIVFFNVEQSSISGKAWKEAYNTIPAFKTKVTGKEILKNVLGSQATSWIWHVSWNKIIRRKFALSAFATLTRGLHIVMYEDLLWSCALYLHVYDQHVISSIEMTGIRYVRHTASATGDLSHEAKLKRAEDILLVVQELEKLLIDHNHLASHRTDFLKTKQQLLTRMKPEFSLSVLNAAERIVNQLKRHKDDKEWCIFGYGELGQFLKPMCEAAGFAVTYFVGTNADGREEIEEIRVISPQQAMERGCRNFIIASLGSCEQIYSTITRLAGLESVNLNIVSIFQMDELKEV